MRKYILPLILIVLWQFASSQNLVNAFLLPSPMSVFRAFVQLLQNGVLLSNISASLLRLIAGFSIAALSAGILSILFYMYPILYEYSNPLIRFMQSIPPLAMLSLIILWFGIGEKSKIVLIVLSGFFPLFVNTLNGLLHCDRKLIEVGSVAGFSKREIFFRILLPNARPQIISGARVGLSYSWRSLTGAELIATSVGLGAMVLEARELSRSDIVLVGIFCFGITGVLIDRLFDAVSARYGNEH